jgi:hypothetical protein
MRVKRSSSFRFDRSTEKAGAGLVRLALYLGNISRLQDRLAHWGKSAVKSPKP